jgi:hypothetical protein
LLTWLNLVGPFQMNNMNFSNCKESSSGLGTFPRLLELYYCHFHPHFSSQMIANCHWTVIIWLTRHKLTSIYPYMETFNFIPLLNSYMKWMKQILLIFLILYVVFYGVYGLLSSCAIVVWYCCGNLWSRSYVILFLGSIWKINVFSSTTSWLLLCTSRGFRKIFFFFFWTSPSLLIKAPKKGLQVITRDQRSTQIQE